MDNLIQDCRYAFRLFRKAPGFSLVIVLVLALGIGAATAVFSIINGILLRPLPYSDPERLLMVWQTDRLRQIPSALSPSMFQTLTERASALAQAAAFQYESYTLADAGEAERLQGATVSGNLFSLLG